MAPLRSKYNGSPAIYGAAENLPTGRYHHWRDLRFKLAQGEGEQLDLLSRHVAQDANRHAAILPDLPHLQTKTNRLRLDHFRAPVRCDGVPPFLSHVMGNGRSFVHLLGDETGIQLARDRVVPGAPLGTPRLLQTPGS
jgi:hypothetical protein